VTRRLVAGLLALMLLGIASPALSKKAPHPALLDPSLATETAPDNYTVKIKTTKGVMLLDVHREWAPLAADRFYNLVKIGFYEDVSVFRVIVRFVAQFGVHGDPAISGVWKDASIPDDPPTRTNAEGTVTFAMAGPNSRTTQVFINLWDNKRLDDMGFAPFGELRDMKVANKLYVGYGEGAPAGRGPDQGKLIEQGNPYLDEGWPKLDRIVWMKIVDPKP
jgi:peptidyl-prolyl cis-trans isomerase A (cyclophilin A)